MNSELKSCIVIHHSKFSILNFQLAIAFAHDDVVGAENGHGIGDHVAFRHVIERSHVNEGRSTDFQAVGFAPASTDDIETKFTLMRLGPTVDLARRSIEALGKQFELLNHRVQIGKDAFFRRERHAGNIRHDRTFLHLLQTLPDDFYAFIQLLNADPVPVIGVPVLSYRNAELTTGIGGIRFIFS